MILDPRELCNSLPSDKNLIPTLIPNECRKMGVIPCETDLKIGDLILVSAIKPDFISKSIMNVQSNAGLDLIHSEWHHAAIYLGGWTICEATFFGVKHSSLLKYCQGAHRIKVRRAKGLSDYQNYTIALQSLLRFNYKYSFRSIIELLFQSRLGWWNNYFTASKISIKATICSQLYADSYGYASGGQTIEWDVNKTISPGMLSASNNLLDVHMNWMSLK